MKGKQHISRHTQKNLNMYLLTEIFLTLPFICLKSEHLIPNHRKIGLFLHAFKLLINNVIMNREGGACVSESSNDSP